MILLKQCYVWYKFANATLFSLVSGTLDKSLVSFVLSEYNWCCVTKSVYDSSGILNSNVKVLDGFWIKLYVS